jgi:hypothetical protein
MNRHRVATAHILQNPTRVKLEAGLRQEIWQLGRGLIFAWPNAD